MKKSSIILFLILAAKICFAQIDNVQTITKTGTAAAQFLKIGVDARASAMGGAFSAMRGALASMHWNPAGLAYIPSMEAMFTHQEWLADINFDYFAFAFHINGFGTLGASITSLTVPQEVVRTVEQPDGTGELFDAGDIAINLSFSKQLTDRFAIGGNAKFIRQNIWHSSANAVAFDIGAIFTTPFRNIRLGASITNFGSDMKMNGRDLKFSEDPDPNNEGNVEFVNALLETDSFPLPLLFRVGIAGELIQTGNTKLTFGIDALEPNDNTSSLNGGVELSFNETLFLRGGYATLFRDDTEEGITFGAGLQYRPWGNSSKLSIDYAYGDFGLLDNVQRFSIAISF
ncbi:MAG: PorV/PorQ family protein [bacterium]